MKRLAASVAMLSVFAVAGVHAIPMAVAQTPSSAPAPQTQNSNGLRITRAGSLPSVRAAAENFTGSVRNDRLFSPTEPSRVSGATVTFEPGARSAWHTHPVGQLLVVTAGVGWVQREGASIEEMRPGDVVWIAPGVKHWHGAAATTAVTHTAITEALDGQLTTWMEKVSDEQYRR